MVFWSFWKFIRAGHWFWSITPKPLAVLGQACLVLEITALLCYHCLFLTEVVRLNSDRLQTTNLFPLLEFLASRLVLSSHYSRTLVCLFWSEACTALHKLTLIVNQEYFELLDVSNNSNKIVYVFIWCSKVFQKKKCPNYFLHTLMAQSFYVNGIFCNWLLISTSNVKKIIKMAEPLSHLSSIKVLFVGYFIDIYVGLFINKTSW